MIVPTFTYPNNQFPWYVLASAFLLPSINLLLIENGPTLTAGRSMEIHINVGPLE